MQLRKRRNIKDATKFKVEYMVMVSDVGDWERRERPFLSQRIMEQWIKRQEKTIIVLILRRMAFINDEWEPFQTIGKNTVTLTDLRTIVSILESE